MNGAAVPLTLAARKRKLKEGAKKRGGALGTASPCSAGQLHHVDEEQDAVANARGEARSREHIVAEDHHTLFLPSRLVIPAAGG